MKVPGNKLRCAALTFAALAIAGCGDRGYSTAPLTPFSAPLANTHEELLTTAKGLIVKRTIDLTADIVVSSTITPAGGWLQIPEAGLFMYFPRGAVSADLVVTATAHAGKRVVYSFEPHGTRFNTPVWIVQEVRYTELNTPRSEKRRPKVWAGYLDDGLADVTEDGYGLFAEVFDAAYYGKGNEALAYFTTMHFSGYAMASGRRESSAGQ